MWNFQQTWLCFIYKKIDFRVIWHGMKIVDYPILLEIFK